MTADEIRYYRDKLAEKRKVEMDHDSAKRLDVFNKWTEQVSENEGKELIDQIEKAIKDEYKSFGFAIINCGDGDKGRYLSEWLVKKFREVGYLEEELSFTQEWKSYGDSRDNETGQYFPSGCSLILTVRWKL